VSFQFELTVLRSSDTRRSARFAHVFHASITFFTRSNLHEYVLITARSVRNTNFFSWATFNDLVCWLPHLVHRTVSTISGMPRTCRDPALSLNLCLSSCVFMIPLSARLKFFKFYDVNLTARKSHIPKLQVMCFMLPYFSVVSSSLLHDFLNF
jgi:hypothetical protein